jgi:hypothetical protein
LAQFATADELGSFLGRSLEPGEVARADLLLRLASARIQSEACQRLELVTDDEVHLIGNYSAVLLLPELPVLDVSAVTVRSGWGIGSSIVIPSGQILWERRGLVQRRLVGVEINGPYVPYGGWGGPYATVDVTYSHGYEVLPDDVRGACLAMAARAWENPDGAIVQSESVDGAMSASYAPPVTTGVQLTEEERKTIRRYRPVCA